MPLSRRRFVAAVSAAGSLAAVELAGGRTARAMTFAAPLAKAQSLKDAAAPHNILFGSAVNVDRLRDDAAYAALIRSQCSILVAENAFKFGPLRPGPDQFFFDDADYLLKFAQANQMKLRGHNFVWHQALPAWFKSYATPQNAEALLLEHIQRVGGRYAGQLHSWDVVNEAIEPRDGLPGGLRNSPWYKLLGPGYIDTAFRAARKADPNALLIYNDYGIEGQDADSTAKRKAVMELLRGMLQRGVPLDGLGIQSHLTAGHTQGAGLRSMITELHAMGLRVLLTEMDVNDRELAADIPTRDQSVGALYGVYLGMTLATGCVSAVLTWGLTDKYTWLNHEDGRKDNERERPLLFDAALRPKPAFTATLAALRSAHNMIPAPARRVEARNFPGPACVEAAGGLEPARAATA